MTNLSVVTKGIDIGYRKCALPKAADRLSSIIYAARTARSIIIIPKFNCPEFLFIQTLFFDSFVRRYGF